MNHICHQHMCEKYVDFDAIKTFFVWTKFSKKSGLCRKYEVCRWYGWPLLNMEWYAYYCLILLMAAIAQNVVVYLWFVACGYCSICSGTIAWQCGWHGKISITQHAGYCLTSCGMRTIAWQCGWHGKTVAFAQNFVVFLWFCGLWLLLDIEWYAYYCLKVWLLLKMLFFSCGFVACGYCSIWSSMRTIGWQWLAWEDWKQWDVSCQAGALFANGWRSNKLLNICQFVTQRENDDNL